ncbi:hypothetical protein Mal33_22530 [Rosistilla oblonga]|uniref:Uncharacterized protein n=1 Tax=Rosistilla oblonga TaxID=2527990 RepID=A0A518IT62_9BACT|nr:hypothetical protein Mal33_22530 [Rosistilla oblonga]
MVNVDRLARLKILATSLHEAMSRYDFSDSGLNLQHFPSECCHQACKLLTMFLFDHGFTEIEKCVGSRPDDPTGEHLWIIVEGFIVDITAYQFDDTLERAIVASDSSWHTQFHGRKKQFGKEQEPLGQFVSRMKIQYASFYEELKQEASRIATE